MDAPQASGRSVRWHRARLVLAVAAASLVVTLVGGYAMLAAVYMPLAEGNAAGPDSGVPGSLYAETEVDPFGTGALFLYCRQPGARFAWYVTLLNDGPLPVTILSGAPGAFAASPDSGNFWLADLARYRANPSDERVDPRTAATLPPTVLDPGAQLEVWARYEIGGRPQPAAGDLWTRSIAIRYSVLGVERTADVPFRNAVGIRSSPCTPG